MSRRIFVGLMVFAPAVLSGCVTAPFLAPVVPEAVAAYYLTASQPQGPRSQFVNESEVRLQVRYWVGRRDITAPRGVADVRTDEEFSFTAGPGEHFIVQLGRHFWTVSNADAVVTVEVRPLDSEGLPKGPVWFRLEQPGPYIVAARGESVDDLSFHRFGGGSISPLPAEEWFDGNNGPFPVRHDEARASVER